MKAGIIGATGMVGQAFLQLIQERNFPVHTLKLYTSPKNVGKTCRFRGQEILLEPLTEHGLQGLDLAFFATSEQVSREWGPKTAEAGAVVIDNSSVFRMKQDIPLVVPEINLSIVKKKSGQIIANPNCSTIQLVLALNPLKLAFGLENVQVASYQSMSGAGKTAVQQLKTESLSWLQQAKKPTSTSDNSPAFNCIPQIGTIAEDGFSTEETKIMNETRKILNLPHLNITATTARVPTFNGHCEAVWISLSGPATKTEVIQALKSQKGVQVLPSDQALPHQHFVDGRDDVYIGRLRHAEDGRTWMMWVGADNLRKGAALNGLQIAEGLFCGH